MSKTTQVQVSHNVNLFGKFTQILQKSPDILFNSKLQNAILKYLDESLDETSIKEIKDEELKNYAELQLDILNDTQKLSVIKICNEAFNSLKSMHKVVFSKQDANFLQKLDENSKDLTNELNQLKIYLSRTRDPVQSLMDAYIKNYQGFFAVQQKKELESENKRNTKSKKPKRNNSEKDQKKQKKSEEEQIVKITVKNNDLKKILKDDKEYAGNLNALMQRIAQMIANIKTSFLSASESLEKIHLHEMKSNNDYILYFLNKTKIDSLEFSVAVLHSLFDFTQLPDYAPDKIAGANLNSSRLSKIKGLVQSLKPNSNSIQKKIKNSKKEKKKKSSK